MECFLVAVLAVLPKPPGPHTPPLPSPSPHVSVPFPSTGKSHPRRSIFLLRAPPSLPTRHFPLRPHSISPVSRSQLSSSSAQLGSHSHISSSLLVVGGTARQDRTEQARFIHSRRQTTVLGCLHGCQRQSFGTVQVHTHTCTHTQIPFSKIFIIVLGTGLPAGGVSVAQALVLVPVPRFVDVELCADRDDWSRYSPSGLLCGHVSAQVLGTRYGGLYMHEAGQVRGYMRLTPSLPRATCILPCTCPPPLQLHLHLHLHLPALALLPIPRYRAKTARVPFSTFFALFAPPGGPHSPWTPSHVIPSSGHNRISLFPSS